MLKYTSFHVSITCVELKTSSSLILNRATLLKMWTLDQQPGHRLGPAQKCRISFRSPQMLDQNQQRSKFPRRFICTLKVEKNFNRRLLIMMVLISKLGSLKNNAIWNVFPKNEFCNQIYFKNMKLSKFPFYRTFLCPNKHCVATRQIHICSNSPIYLTMKAHLLWVIDYYFLEHWSLYNTVWKRVL